MSKLGKALLAITALAFALSALVAPATAGKTMRSTKLNKKLCVTTGGGKFVPIPGFPGERIDRRLLKDIKWMVKRWDIFITDGYSRDSVHSLNGEHPLGLALDIVPDKGRGGTWKKIDRLAAWAEPSQNQPRPPFRWVGYDGDAGHGRGHHLHLSYDHSETRPFHAARTAYSVLCPKGKVPAGGGGGGGNGGGDGKPGGGDGPGGGTDPGGDNTGGTGSGGRDGGKGGKGEGGKNGGKGNGGGGKDEGGIKNGGIGGRIAAQAVQDLLNDPIPAGSVETRGVDAPR